MILRYYKNLIRNITVLNEKIHDKGGWKAMNIQKSYYVMCGQTPISMFSKFKQIITKTVKVQTEDFKKNKNQNEKL